MLVQDELWVTVITALTFDPELHPAHSIHYLILHMKHHLIMLATYARTASRHYESIIVNRDRIILTKH